MVLTLHRMGEGLPHKEAPHPIPLPALRGEGADRARGALVC